MNDLDKKWKRGVVSYFKVLFWHGHAATEENHKNPQSLRSALGPIFEPGISRIQVKNITTSANLLRNGIHTYIHTQRLGQTGRRKWMLTVSIRTCSYFWVATCLNFPRLQLFNQDSVPTKIFS
jgi:hypothetical protein